MNILFNVTAYILYALVFAKSLAGLIAGGTLSSVAANIVVLVFITLLVVRDITSIPKGDK